MKVYDILCCDYPVFMGMKNVTSRTFFALQNEMFELAETADELSGEGEEGQEAVSSMLCDIERSVERLSVEIQGD
jgi:hypothetical protein